MIHAIMLDNYQDRVGPDEYCVSFSGSLEACLGKNDLPDGWQNWAKRDYSNCSFVVEHGLGPEPGKIFRLQPVAAFSVQPAHVAALGIGLALGLAGRALLQRSLGPRDRVRIR